MVHEQAERAIALIKEMGKTQFPKLYQGRFNGMVVLAISQTAGTVIVEGKEGDEYEPLPLGTFFTNFAPFISNPEIWQEIEAGQIIEVLAP